MPQSYPPTLAREQVAKLLNLSPAHFSRKLKSLRADGFPDRLPGLNSWSTAAVMDWINTNGNPVPKMIIDLNADRSGLEKEYGT